MPSPLTVAQRRDRGAEAAPGLRIGVGDRLHHVARARAHDVHGADPRTAAAPSGDLADAVARDVAEARQRRPETAARDRRPGQ